MLNDFNRGQTWPLFVIFVLFLNTLTNIVQNLTIKLKSTDGVSEIRTHNCRMEGEGKSTELWRGGPHPMLMNF